MRIVRYLDESEADRLGREHPRRIRHPPRRLPPGRIFRHGRAGQTATRRLAPIDPVALPCIGLNYRRHAEETGAPIPEHPILFMKTPSSVQHPGGPIVLPTHLKSTEVDYECELAVVIGKACKNVSRKDARWTTCSAIPRRTT